MIAKQTAKQNGKSGGEPTKRQWTAPCYFDINVGELNPDFGESFEAHLGHVYALLLGNAAFQGNDQ